MRRGNRLNGFQSIPLCNFTRRKPGVNERNRTYEFDRLRLLNGSSQSLHNYGLAGAGLFGFGLGWGGRFFRH